MGLSPLAGQAADAFSGAKRPEKRAILRPVNGYDAPTGRAEAGCPAGARIAFPQKGFHATARLKKPRHPGQEAETPGSNDLRERSDYFVEQQLDGPQHAPPDAAVSPQQVQPSHWQAGPHAQASPHAQPQPSPRQTPPQQNPSQAESPQQAQTSHAQAGPHTQASPHGQAPASATPAGKNIVIAIQITAYMEHLPEKQCLTKRIRRDGRLPR